MQLNTSLIMISFWLLIGCQVINGGQGDNLDVEQIDRDVDKALAKLYETTPSAKYLAARAKGILVFPEVFKAGFIGGAEYGKGAMRKNGHTTGYYNIVAGSYGLQAGVQEFSYAMLFMNDAAIANLDSDDGLEIGVGPSIVVMDQGKAKSVTNSTLLEDIYAYVFGQQGLMAGLGLQGSKITRINP